MPVSIHWSVSEKHNKARLSLTDVDDRWAWRIQFERLDEARTFATDMALAFEDGVERGRKVAEARARLLGDESAE